MARHVLTVFQLARVGSRVARHLAGPAVHAFPAGGTLRRMDGMDRDDQRWAVTPRPDTRPGPLAPVNPQQLMQRGANLTRRAVGLGVLALLSILGAGVLIVALVFLGLGLANGSTIAGILMAVVLLLGVLGTVWTVRRAGTLIKPEELPAAPTAVPAAQGTPLALPADTGAVEATLLQTLRTHERPLSAPARAAFHATVIATRDAVRVTAGDAEMNRDAFDARQAAREDLPELMSAYRAVRKSEQTEAQLLEQLQLIHARMSRINAERAAVRQDKLAAHGHYLREKYQGETDE